MVILFGTGLTPCCVCAGRVRRPRSWVELMCALSTWWPLLNPSHAGHAPLTASLRRYSIWVPWNSGISSSEARRRWRMVTQKERRPSIVLMSKGNLEELAPISHSLLTGIDGTSDTRASPLRSIDIDALRKPWTSWCLITVSTQSHYWLWN